MVVPGDDRPSAVKRLVSSSTLRKRVTDAVDASDGQWETAWRNLQTQLPAASVSALSAANDFLDWTQDHRPLESALASAGSVPGFRQLALDHNVASLAELVDASELPPSTVGDTPEQRKLTFARSLRASLYDRVPTAVIQRMVVDDEIPSPDPGVQSGVARVLTNLGPDFNIRRTSLLSALTRPNALDGVGSAVQPQVVERLKMLQRVQAISPTPETVAALVAHGVHSAQSVAQVPCDHFVRQMSGALGPAVAARTHENSVRVQVRNRTP